MGFPAKDLHHFMMQPGIYPDHPQRIEFQETHVSRLYFTGRFVYKIKKAVDLEFLNFTTLDRRHFFCQEETRLNRRLCPDIYLGVESINLEPSGIVLNGPGPAVEYAVRMVQLPAERMLDRLLTSCPPDLPGQLSATAGLLARFHRKAAIFNDRDDPPQREVVRKNWLENFRQTESSPKDILHPKAWSLLQGYVSGFLEDAGTLFQDRQAHDWVREGHGDLHSEHICLTDPIRIFDCIEFNQRFRIADILADLAFLLMDLDFRNQSRLSALVLNAYSTEWPDWEECGDLRIFYKIYRAFVRGKVDSFLAVDEKVSSPARRKARHGARNYFTLALSYLVCPTLILVSGLMGTGKSTLAHRLGQLPGFLLLRSDLLRKKSAGIPPNQQVFNAFGEGLYAPARNEEVYRLLLEKARKGLNEGHSVVVDASFASRAQRRNFVQAARALGKPVLLLALKCSDKTALRRLAQRREEGGDPSDGRRELFARQIEIFDPIYKDERALQVDTEQEVDYNVQSILCRLVEIAGVKP